MVKETKRKERNMEPLLTKKRDETDIRAAMAELKQRTKIQDLDDAIVLGCHDEEFYSRMKNQLRELKRLTWLFRDGKLNYDPYLLYQTI